MWIKLTNIILNETSRIQKVCSRRLIYLQNKNRLLLAGGVARGKLMLWGGGDVLFLDLSVVYMTVFVKTY